MDITFAQDDQVVMSWDRANAGNGAAVLFHHENDRRSIVARIGWALVRLGSRLAGIGRLEVIE